MQPQAHLRARPVQRGVVEYRADEIVHRAPRRGTVDQRPHEGARQGGVAVGEMMDVGALLVGVAAGATFDPQRAGTGEALGHRIDGGDHVDAVAEVVAGAALEEVGRGCGQLAGLGEERAIAGLGEPRHLLVNRTPGEVVARAGKQLRQALPGLVRQGTICEKGIDGPRAGIARRKLVEAEQQRITRNQAILPEVLAIEEHRLRQPEPGIQPAMEHALALEPFRADAQRLQDLRKLTRVHDTGSDHGLGAAVAHQQAAAHSELAPARVAAEIVMVVENENARFWLALAIEPGCCQASETGADDDQVVALLRFQQIDVVALPLTRNPVNDSVGFIGRAPQARERRGVRTALPQRLGLQLLERCKAGGNRESCAVEEVAARDLVRHRLALPDIPARKRRTASQRRRQSQGGLC